jgi:ClpP class serine protease
MIKKQNKVVRLTEDLLSKPQLISKPAFTNIIQYLNNRNSGNLLKVDVISLGDINPFVPSDPGDQLREASGTDNPDQEGPEPDDTDLISVIDIEGALTNLPIETMCGMVGTSYAGLLAQASLAIDDGAKYIILNIDSGGGEAFNCFQAASQLRSVCDQAGVSLTAYVQSCAASAAYAWACVADEIIVHPQGEVGSIGVLISLQNYSKQMEMLGIDQTYITAGENKVPFAADGSFTETFLSDLQAKVDDLYSQFVAHVSQYTGLSQQEIKGTEAATYVGNTALSMGLVNQVMDNQQFVDYMVAKTKGAQDA